MSVSTVGTDDIEFQDRAYLAIDPTARQRAADTITDFEKRCGHGGSLLGRDEGGDLSDDLVSPALVPTTFVPAFDGKNARLPHGLLRVQRGLAGKQGDVSDQLFPQSRILYSAFEQERGRFTDGVH